MHARTYIASIALLFLIILVGAPKISNATVEEVPDAPTTGLFTGLLWSDNIYDQTNIQDGGTYSVTLNKQGYATASEYGTQYSMLMGKLYHLNPDTNSRTLIANLSYNTLTFTWKYAGAYEFDIYNVTATSSVPSDVIHFTIEDADNPCAAPRACNDNVLFIPGIEASRLYYKDSNGKEHQVWEPDYHTDIPYLKMNTDGTSKYKLYTKDIINSLEANNAYESEIAHIFGKNMQVYGKFEKFMNQLVASSTIKKWKAYPYDWRYDVRDVVANGTLVENASSTISRVYIAKVLMKLAATSLTGKVTIIAHSNGGLVAKALVLYLGADASKYIDRIILIGTPQWGTPADIGVLLHGDGQTQIAGIVMRGNDVRAVTKTLPDAYTLLPSLTYFTHIASPVVTFDPLGSITKLFAERFGNSITSFPILSDFLENTAGLDAKAGSANNLRTPILLSRTLINKSVTTHAALDAWTPSHGITVTAIAGWGQDTVKALKYTTEHKMICNIQRRFFVISQPVCAEKYYMEHTPVTTKDGDGTVVSSSAVGKTIDRLYFKASDFVYDKKQNIVHQNLTAAGPIQHTIVSLLTNAKSITDKYISTSTPTGGSNPVKLRISVHSPANLVVMNANKDQSGVLPMPGTDFAGIKRDIPGSAVYVFDDEEYVTVPQDGDYSILASGYASGSATIQVERIESSGAATTTALFPYIPITASSTISFTESNGVSSSPIVDINGDGTADFTAINVSAKIDPVVYIRYMKSVIGVLNLPTYEKRILNNRLSIMLWQLTLQNRFSVSVVHKNWQYYRTRNISKAVIRELHALSSFIQWQVWQSVHISQYHKYSRRRGISGAQASTILNMIVKLKSLL